MAECFGFLISFGRVGQDTTCKTSHVSYINVVRNLKTVRNLLKHLALLILVTGVNRLQI
jgi:hypothetical protein